MSQLLFVYGSLRRGQHAHAQLHGARFLQVTHTLAGYSVQQLESPGGPLPMLVRPPYRPSQSAGDPSDSVPGELYELSSAHLHWLDQYEDTRYLRARVSLRGGVSAWAYCMPGWLK